MPNLQLWGCQKTTVLKAAAEPCVPVFTHGLSGYGSGGGVRRRFLNSVVLEASFAEVF